MPRGVRVHRLPTELIVEYVDTDFQKLRFCWKISLIAHLGHKMSEHTLKMADADSCQQNAEITAVTAAVSTDPFAETTEQVSIQLFGSIRASEKLIRATPPHPSLVEGTVRPSAALLKGSSLRLIIGTK